MPKREDPKTGHPSGPPTDPNRGIGRKDRLVFEDDFRVWMDRVGTFTRPGPDVTLDPAKRERGEKEVRLFNGAAPCTVVPIDETSTEAEDPAMMYFAELPDTGEDPRWKSVQDLVSQALGKKLPIDEWQRNYMRRVEFPVFGTAIHEFLESFQNTPSKEENMTSPRRDYGAIPGEPKDKFVSPFFGCSLSSTEPWGLHAQRTVSVEFPDHKTGDTTKITGLSVDQAFDLLIAKKEELNAKADKHAAKALRAQNIALGIDELQLALEKIEDSDQRKGLPAEPPFNWNGDRMRSRPMWRHPTLVTFSKKFGVEDGKRYDYAAIRPFGELMWSVTGKTTLNRVDWDQVMAFLTEKEPGIWRQRAIASMQMVTQRGLIDYSRITFPADGGMVIDPEGGLVNGEGL